MYLDWGGHFVERENNNLLLVDHLRSQKTFLIILECDCVSHAEFYYDVIDNISK